MKAVRHNGAGFVKITLREPVYNNLLNVLGRFAKTDETADDYEWLSRFLSDLKRRDAEDVGINSAATLQS